MTVAVSDIRHEVVNTHTVVSDVHRDILNTQTIVSDVHHDVSNVRHDVSDTHTVVSNTHVVVSELQRDVANTQTIVSDIHRTMVGNQEAADSKSLPVSVLYSIHRRINAYRFQGSNRVSDLAIDGSSISHLRSAYPGSYLPRRRGPVSDARS